jgi:hypothetical protein
VWLDERTAPREPPVDDARGRVRHQKRSPEATSMGPPGAHRAGNRALEMRSGAFGLVKRRASPRGEAARCDRRRRN